MVPTFWIANWHCLREYAHVPATVRLGTYLRRTRTRVQGDISRMFPVEMFVTVKKKENLSVHKQSIVHNEELRANGCHRARGSEAMPLGQTPPPSPHKT